MDTNCGINEYIEQEEMARRLAELNRAKTVVEEKEEQLIRLKIEISQWKSRVDEFARSLMTDCLFGYDECVEICHFDPENRENTDYLSTKRMVEIFNQRYLPDDATDIKFTLFVDFGLEAEFNCGDGKYVLSFFARDAKYLGNYEGRMTLSQIVHQEPHYRNTKVLVTSYDASEIKNFLTNKEKDK